MADSKHTPLHVGERSDAMPGVLHYTIRDDSGFIVAWVNSFAESHHDKQDAANAAYIVKCCNSHHALVEALKEAHWAIKYAIANFISAADAERPNKKSTLAHVEDALRAAGEEL